VATPKPGSPVRGSRTGRPILALLDSAGSALVPARAVGAPRRPPHVRALRERCDERVGPRSSRRWRSCGSSRCRGRRRGLRADRAGRAAGGAPAAAERVGDGVGETARVAVTERGSAGSVTRHVCRRPKPVGIGDRHVWSAAETGRDRLAVTCVGGRSRAGSIDDSAPRPDGGSRTVTPSARCRSYMADPTCSNCRLVRPTGEVW